jgi:hypothetical protein
MTELILVDGAVIRLTAGALWGWGVSSAPPPVSNIGNFKDVTITGTGSNLTVDGKKTVLQSDITTAMTATTDSYHALIAALPYGLFANVAPLTAGLDGTLLSVTLDSGLTPSTIFRHGTNGVILDSLTGTFQVTITVAAMAAVPPPPSGTPTPDPTLATPGYHIGTWVVQSNGGNTKLKSN